MRARDKQLWVGRAARKSFQNTLIQYFFLIMLILACGNKNDKSSDNTTPLYQSPVAVSLDTSEGYVVNLISGDSILPFFNSDGKIIKTGIRFPVTGKRIPASNPNIIQAGRPEIKPAYTNVHPLTGKPKIFKIAEKSQYSSPQLKGKSSYFLLNSKGDTIPTGKPIPTRGREVPCITPNPVRALPLRLKDEAIIGMQYLDVEQGLNSSYLQSIIEDSKGNIWFGSYNGASKFDGVNFIHYSTKEGLAGNSIVSLMEDSKGNIWFGTSGQGLTKYNGHSFTQLSEKEGLTGSFINSIIEDKEGNIWLGTNEGAVMYDGKSFTHFTVNEGLSSNFISSLYEDKNGNLWFCTFGAGINMYDGKSFFHYTEKDGLADNYIKSVLEDKDGNIWFGSYQGRICKLVRLDDKQSIEGYFELYTEHEGFNSNGQQITSILEDKKGNIWFGTYGNGIIKFDHYSFTYFGEREGLSLLFVSDIMEDQYGNIWIATDGGGLTKLSSSAFTFYTEKDGLPSFYIYSILEDKKGDLWFGTWNKGISRFDGRFFINYNRKDGLIYDGVTCMLEDKKGHIWIGTTDGLSRFDGLAFFNFTTEEGLSDNTILCMLEDHNGFLWIGTANGGVIKYDVSGDEGQSFIHYTKKEGLLSNYIMDIYEDRTGNLWFGSIGGGVTKFDGSTFIQYTEKEGLPSNNIRTIYQDNKNNLWFGTDNRGIAVYNGNSFTYYTVNEGLSGNSIRALLGDENDRLWICTESGFTQMIPSTDGQHDVVSTSKKESADHYKIQKYGLKDGLKAHDFYKTVLLDSNDQIWCATGKGVVRMNKNEFNLNHKPPLARIRRLEINQQVYDFHNFPDSIKKEIQFKGVSAFDNFPLDLELRYNLNHLNFHFSATNLSSPHKIRYKYRIEGLEKKWSGPTEATIAEYRNLSSGSYTFQVQAIGEAQIWGESFNYSFIIRPPWWKSWWAYVLYAVATFVSLFLGIKYRMQHLINENIKLEHRISERTTELKESLENLKSTQALLIQSEKMASLGELTSGIAHEIQNPLNFVNNFSEINKELLEELKGQRLKVKGQRNEQVEAELLHDIEENEKKINHHGKRAESIVKGMLQHNQKTTGIKEPTDINALASEYLRLAYHSFISKEKLSSEIKLITDLEAGLPLVSVIPQDIGRVIINLINNALYAVNEKRISNIGTYEPTVSVLTKKAGDKILISVKDNGNGIPEFIKEKIFQPFFTTKPTGQGTGLGLSLSYDMVKAHGGTLEVTSVDGAGSEFTIALPFKTHDG